jgi:hypothetical protein
MPRRDEVRTSLRLPPDLYEAIKHVAEVEQRSLNTQIERFLREALERWRRRQEQDDDAPPAR